MSCNRSSCPVQASRASVRRCASGTSASAAVNASWPTMTHLTIPVNSTYWMTWRTWARVAPALTAARAGIGFHRLDHQEQQLFLPAREGPGRVSFTQPIPHFSLNRLLDVLADDACPGGFRD